MKVASRVASQIRRVATAATVLIAATACHAQSCALCYTQVAGAGSRLIQGLRSGIIVLIIPPMFMSVGITVLAYRKRNQCVPTEGREEPLSDW